MKGTILLERQCDDGTMVGWRFTPGSPADIELGLSKAHETGGWPRLGFTSQGFAVFKCKILKRLDAGEIERDDAYAMIGRFADEVKRRIKYRPMGRDEIIPSRTASAATVANLARKSGSTKGC